MRLYGRDRFLRQYTTQRTAGISKDTTAPASCQAAHTAYFSLSLFGNDPSQAVCIAQVKNTYATINITTVKTHNIHLRIANYRQGDLGYVFGEHFSITSCVNV